MKKTDPGVGGEGQNSGIQNISMKMPVIPRKGRFPKGIAVAGSYEHKIPILNVSPKKVKKKSLETKPKL